jgi:hypothetical protein
MSTARADPTASPSNRPDLVTEHANAVLENLDADITRTKTHVFVLRAGQIVSTLEAENAKARDEALEGDALSADDRKILTDLSEACRTWVNLDPKLSHIDAARRDITPRPIDPDLAVNVAYDAFKMDAADEGAAKAVEASRGTGSISRFFTGTFANFMRTGLRIAKRYGGKAPRMARWLIKNERKILESLAVMPPHEDRIPGLDPGPTPEAMGSDG